MATINESIEQLTASLQELTVQTYNHECTVDVADEKVSEANLHFSSEVKAFVEEAGAYSAKTRNVSIGTY